jgi:hypothetical protein
MHAADPQSVRDVFIDRFRERIRFLKDHSDSLAKLNHVDRRVIDVNARDFDRSCGNPGAVEQIVHSIKTSKERRFTAP